MGPKGRSKGISWEPPYSLHTICECLRIARGCERQDMLGRMGISPQAYEGWKSIRRTVATAHVSMVEAFFGVQLRRDGRGAFSGVEPAACDARTRLRAEVDGQIDAMLTQPEITAEQLAMRLGCDVDAIEIAVRSETGRGLDEHVWLRRLAHARRLLQHDEHSIAEVARRCGFRHAASFSRAFRRRYGLSPRGFRTGVRESRGG